MKIDNQPDDFLVVWWYILYWSIFTLNWFVFPFMIEFFAAGDFTLKDKFGRAFKNFLPQIGFYIFFFLVMILILACYESGREALKR